MKIRMAESDARILRFQVHVEDGNATMSELNIFNNELKA